jgi:O-acetyl-ADP-ribose deacetylase (regulator of RNase III)
MANIEHRSSSSVNINDVDLSLFDSSSNTMNTTNNTMYNTEAQPDDSASTYDKQEDSIPISPDENTLNEQIILKETMFILDEVQGDVFSSSDALCHCIGEDLNLEKGIGRQFKRRFGPVNEPTTTTTPRIGNVVIVKTNNPQRFIYYLVTKDTENSRTTYATLEMCLRRMKDHMIQTNVTQLSMPKIGCGYDRLQWEQVQDLILEVFADCNCKITVYTIPPQQQQQQRRVPMNRQHSRQRHQAHHRNHHHHHQSEAKPKRRGWLLRTLRKLFHR